MAEFVKKTALGYKAVPGGYSDPECRYVILTKNEYSDLNREIAQAEREKTQASNSIRQIQTDANKKIRLIEEQAEEQIKQALNKVDIANDEIAYQVNLNKNLLRINKEKSNAERKLRPKKEHTGYVVISSQEKEIRYRSGKQMLPAVVWETVLQSPYSIEFSEEQARKQIYGELLTNDGGWMLGEIGIISTYMALFEEMVEKFGKTIYDTNRAYSGRLRANYKAGYWEYIVLHTLPLGQVPKNMLP